MCRWSHEKRLAASGCPGLAGWLPVNEEKQLLRQEGGAVWEIKRVVLLGALFGRLINLKNFNLT